ncbi:hypothetical protein DUNSADRAFT_9046 [Dunaliella salina]|uniref:JmjC domain-containing protein n=1 Tax=Dunaliella salina TaxID=3046 RepID=A0ABQ7FSK5_DUNSA|nr:hypothetical protein DUNSADRAFT_9046 [Dunaliella salina]|eukprot:KAF5825515.1 hypothetical protein DUNSADRAFT_9046 [Dunaliella salina]
MQNLALNVSVAVALMFVTLGIPWTNLSNTIDGMVWDNTAANQYCAGCHTKLHCHAYMDMQSCACFCYYCNKGDTSRRHDYISSFSDLLKMPTFLEKYLPSQLSYFHLLQKSEWLGELAMVQPCTSRPQISTVLKQSVAGWKECVNDIISHCKNPHTLVQTQYTSASILRTLLKKGSPSSDHQHLHPYALPLKTNFLNSLMKELRSSEVIVNAQKFVSDRTITTILLFSPSGVQTPFHFDWTEAKNLALEVEGITDPERPVAAWYFVNLLRFEPFFSFFNDVQFAFQKVPKGKNVDEHVFSERHCLKFISQHADCMVRLEQHVGEIMHVPPGWLHAVFTLQPAVKMAWDFVELVSFAKYMAAWAHVGTLMRHSADDYIGMATVLVEHALRN